MIADFEEQITGKKAFHFLPANQLCAAPRSTQWLIKPFLDVWSLGNIFGESGSMKSFLGIDMGLSIASFTPWHGYNIRTSGPVFFICGEGFGGISGRLKAWSIHNDVSLDHVPFFVSSRPARLLDAGGVEEVLEGINELMEANGRPVLVIVDTLNRNFGPGDENSTSDMTRFVAALDEVRLSYGCAVLIIHHSGLSASDRARGASALRASLDWEYKMTKDSSGIRTLTCTKSKDHAETQPIRFMPEVVTLDGWTDEDGETMTSCVLVETDAEGITTKPLRGARKVAYDALMAAGNGEPVFIDTWRDAAYKSGISATSSSEAKKKAFQRAVIDLLDAGLVISNHDYWKPYDGTKRDI